MTENDLRPMNGKLSFTILKKTGYFNGRRQN